MTNGDMESSLANSNLGEASEIFWAGVEVCPSETHCPLEGGCHLPSFLLLAVGLEEELSVALGCKESSGLRLDYVQGQKGVGLNIVPNS